LKNKQYTLLTIDDDEVVRESISIYLEDSGFDVHEACCGHEGVEFFAKLQPDIVLTDLQMPDMGGLDVISKIRDISPETPIIVVSGTGVLEDSVEAIRRGAWDYIYKPITDLELMGGVIQRSLDKACIQKENHIYQRSLEKEIELRMAELERNNIELLQQISEKQSAVQKKNEIVIQLEKSNADLRETSVELKRNQQQYLKLSEHSPDILMRFDSEYKILYANKMARDFCHAENNNIIGKLITDLGFHDDVWDIWLNGMEFLAWTHDIYSKEYKFIIKGKQVYHALRIVPELDEDDSEKNFLVVCSDITEQKLAEKELVIKQSQIVHAGRLAALGEMATAIAHEINQPLNIIKISSDCMKEELEEDDLDTAELADISSEISDQVDRAAEIIRNIQAFSRQDSTVCDEFVDLKLCVESAVKFFKEQLRLNNVVLKLDLADGLPDVHLKAGRFQQVVVNLISNSQYALAEKKKIADADFVQTISIRLFRDDKNMAVVMEHKDNGTGMDAEVLKKCMDPFYTTKPVDVGTGLGTSIMYGIIREADGRIEVESVVDEWTLFRVIIPI